MLNRLHHWRTHWAFKHLGVEVHNILEQWFVQRWRRCEGTEAADQQQPASQQLLVVLQLHCVVDQLGQDLVPQRRPAETLLRYVVTQHPLLPVTQVRLSSEAQDLRRGEDPGV